MRCVCLRSPSWECLPASPVSARDWYVNNVAGDDIKDGLSEISTSSTSGPVRSITKALWCRQDGLHHHRQHRRVLSRRVSRCAGLHSGRPEAPFTIVGNGATLDGSNPVPDDAWEFYRGELFRFSSMHAFTNAVLGREAFGGGGKVDAQGRIQPLKPLEWAYLEGTNLLSP